MSSKMPETTVKKHESKNAFYWITQEGNTVWEWNLA